MRRLASLALAALLLAPASGCLKDTITLGPGPLLVPENENPDVIWIVRQVSVEDDSTYWGLFACYRRPASDPGHPICYLAEIESDLRHLSWPGDVRIRNGELRSRRRSED